MSSQQSAAAVYLTAGKAVSAMLVEQKPVVTFLEGVGTKLPGGGKIPFIAVPTTAGTGSEATSNGVISSVGPEGFKKSLRHNNYVPDIALIDPELALDCPKSVTLSCGMDALSQLVEGYLSTNSNPYTDALALEGIRKVLPAVAGLEENPGDIDARSAMAYGAYLSGIVLANAGLGLVHGFASAIGGFHRIPHGVVCGTLMAEVNRATLEKLRSEAPQSHALQKYAELGKLVNPEAATAGEQQDAFIKALVALTEALHIPGLGRYDISREDLPKITEKSGNKYNPISFGREEMANLLANCLNR